MARNTSSRRASSINNARGASRSSSTGAVSQARLNQRSGSPNAFGGFTKVKNSDGSFRMRPTGK